MGRGGGLSTERNDYAPLDLGPVSATDVALLRPPTGLWGYNMQATDEALERIAEAVRERDVRIVALEQLVTDLSRRDHAPMPVLGPPILGARHRREAATVDTDAVPVPQPLSATEPARPAVTVEADAEATGWSSVAAQTAESARLPFELPKPNGDASSAVPEESHD